MAQEFSFAFYHGMPWRRTQKAYIESQQRVCERCGDMAELVHHKIHLTPQNINDPDIALGWDNLQALCRRCHAEVHGNSACANGLRFDDAGNLVPGQSPRLDG